MSRAAKPRASDVARWVAIIAAPLPSPYMVKDTRIAKREKDNAKHMLATWDLGIDGLPRVKPVSP